MEFTTSEIVIGAIVLIAFIWLAFNIRKLVRGIINLLKNLIIGLFKLLMFVVWAGIIGFASYQFIFLPQGFGNTPAMLFAGGVGFVGSWIITVLIRFGKKDKNEREEPTIEKPEPVIQSIQTKDEYHQEIIKWFDVLAADYGFEWITKTDEHLEVRKAGEEFEAKSGLIIQIDEQEFMADLNEIGKSILFGKVVIEATDYAKEKNHSYDKQGEEGNLDKMKKIHSGSIEFLKKYGGK